MVTWSRHRGYEVSSRGDKRFSALFARLSDGRAIEAHYQCDVKGYMPGGTDWRVGKGKPPLDRSTDTWRAYLGLWQQWAAQNPALIEELRALAAQHDNMLRDRFASTQVNQARALSEILNAQP